MRMSKRGQPLSPTITAAIARCTNNICIRLSVTQWKYVNGNIHTNSIENFWSLLKRTIKGTYVSVEPFHLDKYVNEQTFRFNNRSGNEGTRFLTALDAVSGRRLTYSDLIGSKPSRTN